jgi:hypothetical protein
MKENLKHLLRNEDRLQNISKQTVDVCIKIAENKGFVVIYLQFCDPETPV